LASTLKPPVNAMTRAAAANAPTRTEAGKARLTRIVPHMLEA
jgi:hypothetical protein